MEFWLLSIPGLLIKNGGHLTTHALYVEKCVKMFLVTHSYLDPGYKTFFMLNSAEQEIYPAHKC